MSRKSVYWLVLLLCFALVLSACKKEEPATEPEVTEAATEATEPVTEPATEATEPEPTARRMFDERYPYAVMIDNHPDARQQSGLQNASIIYEMLVEGVTRMMIVTDEEAGVVGPIRSARPIFVNAVVENGGFYSHVGNYEYVQEMEIGDRVKDMDQFFHAGNAYYRANHKVPPHNMYADLADLYSAAESEGYSLEVDEPLGYLQADEVQVREGGEDAASVGFAHDGYQYQRYTYDEEKAGYVKTIDGTPVLEERTEEPLVIQSLVVLQLPHWRRDNGVHYGMEDVGSGTATLYEGGQSYEIEWSRQTNGDPLVLSKDGEELVFSPGLLYIQCIPDWVEVGE